jgi:hypothetical protein
MGMVLDIFWWVIKHWLEITAAVLALDKVVTITPNPYDDMLITGAKWMINKVRVIKQWIVNAILPSKIEEEKKEKE